MPIEIRPRFRRHLSRALTEHCSRAAENLAWLHANLHPYFFVTMAEETDALVNLAAGLRSLVENRQLVLSDREEKLILACPNLPGTVYESLRALGDRPISYAEITHSRGAIPGAAWQLEIHRFEFGPRSRAVEPVEEEEVPPLVKKRVVRVLR
ncbi:MAG: amino acid dehydrogenase, partial [Deltaproteobacteria bacterium]|nr:amino acid dehydrogenase [Deltaproteobacteria bacterium]